MLPNPASWRPGLRWTPGKEASLCFHPLKFCLFFFVFSVLMSVAKANNCEFATISCEEIDDTPPASLFSAPCLLYFSLLCLFSLSFLISPFSWKKQKTKQKQVWSCSAVRQRGEWLRVWGGGQWLNCDFRNMWGLLKIDLLKNCTKHSTSTSRRRL